MDDLPGGRAERGSRKVKVYQEVGKGDGLVELLSLIPETNGHIIRRRGSHTPLPPGSRRGPKRQGRMEMGPRLGQQSNCLLAYLAFTGTPIQYV